MDAGALEPEPLGQDVDARGLQAARVVFQRAFRPAEGRGEGGQPSAADPPGAPVATGGAKAGGKGGPFQGRCWK
eukprot:14660389-Alexandrium_andersonii.AAC.1